MTRTRRVGGLVLVLALGGVAASPVHAQVGKPVTIVDANSVSEADLAKLPHITAALAKAVVSKRPFANITPLDQLLGATLSKEQRAELDVKLFVPLNLNSATPEQIQLIPGVGPRMTKEFLEYRPYTSLAVFDREIGKYVDKTEVARLAQYVFVPVQK